MYLAANIRSQNGHLTFKAELDIVVSTTVAPLPVPSFPFKPLAIGGAGVGGLGLFISNWIGDGVAEEEYAVVVPVGLLLPALASLCT